MSTYRHKLPQVQNEIFLTDGGMETTLIFHDAVELPHFASFVLLATEQGKEQLRAYYRRYLALAARHRVGFILDTPTWRANPDWGALLDYGPAELAVANLAAVDLMAALRREFETPKTPCVISGMIGPCGDGYRAGRADAAAAADYHAVQIATFAASEADMVAAYTLTTVEEAIGIARAARAHAIPCAISFTVEQDGRLVTGPTLREAVEAADEATGGAPAYYMVNCAHPSHFAGTLDEAGAWRGRILGVRANASTQSHAELDAAETLDAGDPADFGRRCLALRQTLPALRVLGGCCGTDHRHVAAICEACL